LAEIHVPTIISTMIIIIIIIIIMTVAMMNTTATSSCNAGLSMPCRCLPSRNLGDASRFCTNASRRSVERGRGIRC